jgi:hypothetical protein
MAHPVGSRKGGRVVVWTPDGSSNGEQEGWWCGHLMAHLVGSRKGGRVVVWVPDGDI